MTGITIRGLLGGLGAAVAATMMALPASAADTFVKPTPEELSMTSIPGYPGAPAVILFREEITKDDLHVMQHYERIKVLTEKGKQYANVELKFFSSHGDTFDDYGDDKNITDIQGRTIHPDGTIIPFTGKPYLKTMAKEKTVSYQARVFTLPDVEVGSILEYRYATRISDYLFESPTWFVQGDLYTKSVHFAWYPTTREIGSDEGIVSSIAWFPILPQGAEVKRRESPTSGVGRGPQQTFELTAQNIPPEPDEEYMPPLSSFTYRVLFYYTPYHTGAEFWKATGKKWAKSLDGFTSSDKLSAPTQTVIAGATTQDAKLRKIYAAVMGLENTDFSRNHGKTEDQAAGLGKLANAADIYQRGRGNGQQLTEVFVGMARAAGMKAYFMAVPDRERRLFTPAWLSMEQFDDMVAIVNVDGKDQYFDPAQRYCPYGQLAWQDTFVQGVREVDGGTDFAITPGASYSATKTQRVGDLTMDERGEVKGTATLTFIGSTALQWRQRALAGDEASLKRGLRNYLESMVPKTLDVKVSSIENLTEYEKPLIAKFDVSGGMGTPTGKRWILPADVFLTGESNTFPHEKREMSVYFHYAQSVLDAVRIKYPASMTLEASPAETKVMFSTLGQYNLSSTTEPHAITVRRTFLFNTVIVYPKEYDTLRTFYSQFEAKDKESIVLKAEAAPAAAAGN